MKHLLILIFLVTCCTSTLWATHNRAGEITYQQIDDLTIRIKITTYTQTNSIAADRDSLLVFWGDGTSEYVFRTNGNGKGVALPNNIKLNEYEANHSYPGQATYTVGFKDKNRVGNILNVNSPNSIEVPFYVQTTFTFLSTQTKGINNSAILLQPPVDVACVNEVFIHNPGASDIDGDSLAYELGVPAMASNVSVPMYFFPDEIGPGPENNISIDPVTGDFVWDSPKLIGQYNVAILIKEYRKGVLINTIVRDMQIQVNNCFKDGISNAPPVIEAPDEICVVAGELIEFDLNIFDPNTSSRIEISANGGPFQLDSTNAAVFTTDGIGFQEGPRSATFSWQTQCEHISKYGYQIIIKAQDLFCDRPSLTSLKTIQIKVVGPPPENLNSEAEDANIRLKWDFPYACMNAEADFFRGFSVWRKLSSENIPLDTCAPGLDNSGYQKIVFLTKDNDGISYIYLDDQVERGNTYCYRVLAEFALETKSGQLYNLIESLPSNETCRQLARDLPLITNVTVDETSLTAGEITVKYLKPLAEELDTVEHPGPYRYEIWRSEKDINNFQLLAGSTQVVDNYSSPLNLTIKDIGINTQEQSYYYRVDFYVNGSMSRYGSSKPAESPFVLTNPQDRAIRLQFSADVPWNNYEYVIERLNPITMDYDSIGLSFSLMYEDIDLINGEEYCYRVKTIGSYGLDDTPRPLINYSNIVCERPIDNEPPCSPILKVESLCDGTVSSIDIDNLINTLTWTNPNEECNETMDIQKYRIYFSEIQGEEKQALAEIEGNEIDTYLHNLSQSIAGCYEITAIDDIGNESPRSNEVCVDNCPEYILPNTFTPNQDDFNDLFTPRVNRFIESVDFNVFNRWGNKVFSTQDPAINWTGTDESGVELSEGVYFYTCRVTESRVFGSGQSNKFLKGDIHLIKSE